MNILVLTPWIPDPSDGVGGRIYHFIKFLSLNYKHRITLFVVADTKSSDSYLSQLRKYCNHIDIFRTTKSTEFTIFSPKIPFIIKNMTSIQNLIRDHIYFNQYYMPMVMNVLKETINAGNFDIAFVYCIDMSLYLANIGIPTLVDLQDALFDEQYKLYKLESNLINKQLHWFMYYLFKKWTKDLPKRGHNNLVVTTLREADVFSKIIPTCRITAVNNGVDTDYFSPGETAEEYPSIVFIGTMGSPNNTMAVCHFYNNIYPYVRKEITNIKFYIVGRCPPQYITSIATSDKSVIVTGEVPDVRPYLDRASVIISPMISGTGIKNKVLQAMAMSKPVICTPESVYGINVKNYENIIIADSDKNFADEIIKLLNDAQLRHLIGVKARETVVQQHSWAKAAEILNACLEKSACESRKAYID